jgi:lipopolysaccharide biosynthesis glycosyltransferase
MKKLKMNLLTSCTDGIAHLILPQLESLAATNSRYELSFYLFHTDVSDKNLKALAGYAERVGISFFEVRITDTAPYELLASHGGRWPKEAYYYIGLERYLPPDMDRIMYIDAGDNYINGDLGRYYFSDFYGKSLTALMYSCWNAKDENGYQIREFNAEDLENPKAFSQIARGAIYGSSMIFNLEKIRSGAYSVENFVELAKTLVLMIRSNNPYFGDQGILSVAYLEDVNLYGFPELLAMNFDEQGCEQGLFTYVVPYCFAVAAMIEERFEFAYEPVIIHFDFPEWKPWKPSFTPEEFEALSSPGYTDSLPYLKTMADYHAKYWDYVRPTPIYEELREQARKYCEKNSPR